MMSDQIKGFHADLWAWEEEHPGEVPTAKNE
jgi:hypothetical protein